VITLSRSSLIPSTPFSSNSPVTTTSIVTSNSMNKTLFSPRDLKLVLLHKSRPFLYPRKRLSHLLPP
jgi:hypothetical protein